jgi:N-sulfoglucosamine sulfohydrolase
VVRWGQGISRPGSVSTSLVSVIDIAPTLLELAGVAVPAAFQGKSFSGILKDPATEIRQHVFAEHNWHDYEAHERMVRTRNFLYVRNARPNLSNPGPADSNKSPSFADLKSLRDQGRLSVVQADVFLVPRPQEELYDCKKDPMQLVNVAALPEYQGVLRDLRAVLGQWQDETKDNTPAQLTKDWFDRETGEPLDKENQVRGEMPGARSGATNKAKAQ